MSTPTPRLVTVRRIAAITPIPNTPSAVLHFHNSTQTVVVPQAVSPPFIPGELAVHVAPGALLPRTSHHFQEYVNDEAPLSAARDGAGDHDHAGRVVVVDDTCLRHGRLSQGLAFHLGKFFEIVAVLDALRLEWGEEGEEEAERRLMKRDFAALLGVK